MTIAITGATGQLGQLVIDKLKTKVPAGQIIALARNPEKGDSLGVTVRKADYAKPEMKWTPFSGPLAPGFKV